VADLDRQLSDPRLFADNPVKAGQIAQRRHKAQARLDAAEAEWIAAAEAVETATR
jgi:hypothetical protein